MKKKSIFFIVAAVTVMLSLLAVFGLRIGGFEIKGANSMRFGIDIRGGVEATYEPKDLDRAPTDDELESAKAVIENRMDALNITDREVTIDKTNGVVIVRFPWKSDETDFDPQAAVSELGETAKLTFRAPDGAVVLEGSDVIKSYAKLNSSRQPEVVLELSAEGTTKFSQATGRLKGKVISIYMDETLISAPTVNSQITSDTAVIEHIKTLEEATDLASKINSGALPFSLTTKNCQIITPTLGSGALEVMIRAGELAFALVCLFMLLYYRLPGLVACVALMLQVVGQLLALSIPQFTLTLPGIAGVILSIGMGVDANVIVSERIKEELQDGKPLHRAVELGFHRAFSSVFDGNITVIIVSFILIIFGSGAMLSFGYTLLFGCLMNFVAGVTASRLMIRSLSEFKALNKPWYFGVRKSVGTRKTIRFYKHRYVYFAISLAVLLTGVVFTFVNGVKLDIQFQGGSILEYTYVGTMDSDAAGEVIQNALGKPAECRLETNMAKDEQTLTVSLAGNEAITSQEQSTVTGALAAAYPDAGLQLSESLTVEPFIGARFFRNGLIAIGLSFLLILVYVGFRFRNIGGISAGTMAIIALIHDALVVTAVFIVFQIPLNDEFIAAILTIIGFSINDTIVIYDRIRENKTLMGKKVSPEELVDRSITESMSRSINTNIAVFISITIVFAFAQIFDIETIRDFALPMMFGTVSGCYSTICIAGPLWTMWRKHRLAKGTLTA